MATTQMPIEGVFNRETGQFIGVSDENGQEILVPTFDSQNRLLDASGAVALDVGAAQKVVQSEVLVTDPAFGLVNQASGTQQASAAAAASAASAAAGGGWVHFPAYNWNFTFTKPPYGVGWVFDGPAVTRQQLGGTSNAVVFRSARLDYIDGPHATSQIQSHHIRTIAKGSGAIGAQFADYNLGLTVEKENWTEAGGAPVAGEINNLTLFLRNGAVTGDPVKTGGAAILANVGATAGSGYTQVLEALNTTFAKGTLATTRQTNIQLLGIDERDNLSYGAIFNSNTGTQNSVIRAVGTTAAPWVRLIENFKDSVLNFFLDDTGAFRWRLGSLGMRLEQESASGAMVWRNEGNSEVARLTQTGFWQALGTTNVQTGTAYTAVVSGATSDQSKTVVLANTSPITLTLPNNAPIGFSFDIMQRDPGQVTVTPASGAILRNASNHTKTRTTYSICRLSVLANSNGTSAVWYLSGDTSA